MPVARHYDDPCGTARALGVVGERWALLVVRELLFGPQRFGSLRAGLHGVSPNVLSQRLRELEDAGVVRRDQLDPPANVAVYELTERGRALEPVLIELGRWGAREAVASTGQLSPAALALALKTTFVGGFDVVAGVRIDGEWFTVSAHGSSCSVTRGRPAEPGFTIEGDSRTIRAYSFGRESPAVAAESGLVVTGSRMLARRFPKLFRVPG